MTKQIDTEGVRELVDAGALLIEVLPAVGLRRGAPARRDQHPAATTSARMRSKSSTRKRPTVVYCYDYQCDLSARGAHSAREPGLHRRSTTTTASKVAWLGQGCRRRAACRHRARRLHRPHRRPPVHARHDGRRLWPTIIGRRAARGRRRRRPRSSSGSCAARCSSCPATHARRRGDAAGAADRAARASPPTSSPRAWTRTIARYVLVSHLDGALIGLIERADLHGRH